MLLTLAARRPLWTVLPLAALPAAALITRMGLQAREDSPHDLSPALSAPERWLAVPAADALQESRRRQAIQQSVDQLQAEAITRRNSGDVDGAFAAVFKAARLRDLAMRSTGATLAPPTYRERLRPATPTPFATAFPRRW